MLHYIIKIRRSKVWWRVTLLRGGLVSTYSFVMPMLIDWLRDTFKEEKK